VDLARQEDAVTAVTAAFTTADWWPLFAHFLAMSMLAVGGALATTPEIHRYVVEQRHWLDDTQFSAAIALAQAAPGPNLLFVPVLGHAIAGLPGALVALAGMLIPSTTLALAASRWGEKRRHTRGVRAFVAGMAPVTIGLLLAAGTVLAQPFAPQPTAWLLIAATIVMSLKTKISPAWLIGVGAIVGAMGWV
jgi:chromate transporter